MTVNACIVCGEIGSGILLPCRKCDYIPKTGWEMAFAAYNSDQSMTLDDVRIAGRNFSERFAASKPLWFKFSESDEQKLLQFLRDPSGRDLWELRRGAKDSFLKKQLNFHFIGPDGYENTTVTRGKDVHKAEFDTIKPNGSNDVFLISTYVAGERKGAPIPKDIWCAVKDHFNLLDRLLAKEGKMLSVITGHARHHTDKYLATRGLDLTDKEAE